MSRALKVGLCIAAFLVGLAVVVRLSCGQAPTKAERAAQAQVDSQPQWHREAKDSQAVLDSLATRIAKVRADSARVARQVRALRQRKDSLATVTAQMQAVLDSIPPLETQATASDSTAHWSSIAIGQGHVIRTMADEILACRQGDAIYEGRTSALEGALSQCMRRAAIFEGQRNESQIRLDRSVGLLERMIDEKKHAGDWNLPFGIHVPDEVKCVALAAVGGVVGSAVDKTRGAVLGGGAALVGCLVS